MREQVGPCVLLVEVLTVDVGVDAQRSLFVSVGATDGHGDGEDSDIHHDEEGDLDGRADFSEIEGRCTSVTGGSGLEKSGEDAGTHRQAGGDFIVVKVEGDDKDHVEGVKSDENPEQNPGGFAGEEEGVAAAWVFEEEIEWLAQFTILRDDVKEEPDTETEEDWVAGVACKCQECHDQHGPGSSSERDHRVRREGES